MMNVPERILLETGVPIIRNPPSNLVNDDAELFEEALHYRTNDVYLKRFGKVMVSPDSVLYKNGILMEETLATQEHRSYYRLKHLAKKLLTGRKVNLDKSKSFLLVTDAWSTGHYHWFTEVLPRIWTIRNRASEFVLLLPDSKYVRNVGLKSLSLLKIEFEDIVLMNEVDFYIVSDLSFVSRVASPGQTNDRIISEISEAFIGNRKAGQNKIYVSRAKANKRHVLNEDELSTLLKQSGFEILYGEDLKLEEQIDVFAECSTLIGVHGAGLTNCIFMKRGGIVVELRKRERNFGYWHLADSLQHKFYYYHGVPDSEVSLIGNGCNLTVSIVDFDERLLSEL